MAESNAVQSENVDFSNFYENITFLNDENNATTQDNNPSITNGFYDNKTSSKNSSPLSSRSNSIKDNDGTTDLVSTATVPVLPDKDSLPSDSDSQHLDGGYELLGESETETARASLYIVSDDNQTSGSFGKQPLNMASSLISLSNGTGTAKARAAKSPYSSSTSESIPEEEVSIPTDCNISSFTCNQLANFLRCFNVEKRIIAHLYRKNVDGKRFSKLRDSELENLGMKNPVIVFFRDKSSAKPAKKKSFFVL